MDALFRVHASPVPTQITLGFFGSIVTAPIDWTACLSNTGLKVVPALTDFHTPPLAAPTYTVSRGPSCTAASAAMRSEEHTSELQSQSNLVCRPLLEKKNR